MSGAATRACLPRPPAGVPPLISSGLVEADRLGTSGIFLRPGDWLFGHGAVRVATLLGSCVALVLWAPRLRLGAVCHCVLPARPQHEALPRAGGSLPAPDGRYGDETGRWLAQRFADAQCPWSEVEAALAGGASSGSSAIGPANIAWAQQWAAAQGLTLMQQDVGGRVLRRLTFNLADGSLTIAHGGRFGGKLA